MRQARSVEVTLVIDEDLCFVDKPAKCGGMDDAVAIALILATIGGGRFFVAPAPTLRLVGRIRCKSGHQFAASSNLFQ